MLQFLLPALIGAGLGAAANKGNRGKGALIGAGLGAGGGFLMGPGALTGAGLLGGAQPPAPISDAIFTVGQKGMGTGAGPMMPGEGGLLDSMSKYAQAGKTGLEVAGMMNPQQQPIQHAQMPAQNPNAPSMAGLFGEIQQAEERRKQEEMQRRMQKRGGFYG
jgi:hypothetical protein